MHRGVDVDLIGQYGANLTQGIGAQLRGQFEVGRDGAQPSYEVRGRCRGDMDKFMLFDVAKAGGGGHLLDRPRVHVSRIGAPLAPRRGKTPGMELSDAIDFARSHRRSVLTTIRRNGRPQLSNVGHLVSDDGLIRISVTADRAKYKNLVREPWAALHVTRDDFSAYVVVEADVELSPVAADPNDATVNELVEHYQALAGDHPNWDDYRAAMVAERRAVVRLAPRRAYGMLQLPSGS
jgi:PPOX class probable F420-dependent enzyme